MGQTLSKNKSYDVAAAKADETEGEGQIKPVVSIIVICCDWFFHHVWFDLIPVSNYSETITADKLQESIHTYMDFHDAVSCNLSVIHS